MPKCDEVGVDSRREDRMVFTRMSGVRLFENPDPDVKHVVRVVDHVTVVRITAARVLQRHAVIKSCLMRFLRNRRLPNVPDRDHFLIVDLR